MVPPGHFAGASYRNDSPRDFGPRIACARRTWFQAVFRYPCPRQGSEGGRSRPLDHMRQIPFVVAPQFHHRLRFTHIYISQCNQFLFHVVRVVHACARAKTDIMPSCSLGDTANGLLLHYFILTIFISYRFPENDCFSDGLSTLLRKCLCIRWLKIILMSIQRLQTACSDLPNNLQKPSNCTNVIRLRTNSLFKALTDCTRKAAYYSSRYTIRYGIRYTNIDVY